LTSKTTVWGGVVIIFTSKVKVLDGKQGLKIFGAEKEGEDRKSD